MLLYYITDRRQFAGTEAEQRARLLERIAAAARAGIDYIQLREKDLSPRRLECLAREAVACVRRYSTATKLLINSRADIALACDADGVHLPDGDLPASEIRALWMKCSGQEPMIGVSTHSVDGVRYAEAHAANFAVLAPIFGKVPTSAPGIGVGVLREACAAPVAPGIIEAPYTGRFHLLALGGVSLENAADCLRAGAAGLAGIRLFQEGDVGETVQRLRSLTPVSRH